MAKPRQKSGTQYSPHKPHNVPERFVALIPKVCTRAVAACDAQIAALVITVAPDAA